MDLLSKKYVQAKEIAELKEEISTLQGKLDAYQMSEQEASEIIAELKAENEQLKKSIDRIMQDKEIKTIDLDIAFENQKLKQENERLKELKCKFKEYCTCNTEKYKQTLQEIKELARGLINGSIGGCEDDIGYMLQDIITKAEEE